MALISHGRRPVQSHDRRWQQQAKKGQITAQRGANAVGRHQAVMIHRARRQVGELVRHRRDPVRGCQGVGGAKAAIVRGQAILKIVLREHRPIGIYRAVEHGGGGGDIGRR